LILISGSFYSCCIVYFGGRGGTGRFFISETWFCNAGSFFFYFL